jgi:hypothetical protein
MDHTLGDLSLAPDADGVVVGDDGDELVVGHCLFVVVDLEALGLERPDGILADVLEQKQPQVVVVDGVQHLWLTDAPRPGLLTREEALGKVGHGRRDGHADGGRPPRWDIYRVRHGWEIGVRGRAKECSGQVIFGNEETFLKSVRLTPEFAHTR